MSPLGEKLIEFAEAHLNVGAALGNQAAHAIIETAEFSVAPAFFEGITTVNAEVDAALGEDPSTTLNFIRAKIAERRNQGK